MLPNSISRFSKMNFPQLISLLQIKRKSPFQIWLGKCIENEYLKIFTCIHWVTARLWLSRHINWLKISFYNDSGFATLEKIHCSNLLFRRGQNIIFWFLRSTLELLNVIALAISHRDFTFYAKSLNVTSLNFMPLRENAILN